MQLATSGPSGLWVCNVHYYADEQLNFYWISTEDTEHSQHIAENSQAGAAVLVHEDTDEDPDNIGISISGTAGLLPPGEVPAIGKAYIDKFNSSVQFLDELVRGTSKFKLYQLTTDRIVLFDSKNFPKAPRQEVNL